MASVQPTSSAQIASPSSPSPTVSAKPSRRLRAALTIVVMAIFFSLGYTVIPWYYYYFDLRNQVAAVLRNGAIESDEELRRKIVVVVAKAGIEKDGREISIQRSADAIRAGLRYTEAWTVSILGRRVTILSMNFQLAVHGKIR